MQVPPLPPDSKALPKILLEPTTLSRMTNAMLVKFGILPLVVIFPTHLLLFIALQLLFENNQHNKQQIINKQQNYLNYTSVNAGCLKISVF